MIRITIWCLAYLWTAAAALAISYSAGWQYDGDAGWWLVTAYSLPALALASPLLWVAGNPDLGEAYCLVVLAALTATAAIVARAPSNSLSAAKRRR